MEIRLVPLGTVEVGFDEACTNKVRHAETRPAKFYYIQLVSLLGCAREAVQVPEKQSVRRKT